MHQIEGKRFAIRRTKYGVHCTVQQDQFTNLALVFSKSIY